MKMKDELSDFIEAAGLQSYDPDEISNIYKKHPSLGHIELIDTVIGKSTTNIIKKAQNSEN